MGATSGGFEELVKRMHETGSVKVERNVKKEGKSGANRQIDVLISHTQGLYVHETIAECKYWNKRVSRLHVDALATTIRELGASKGAIFSTKGFQDGAIKQARHEGIDLYNVREPTNEEWGAPGRHVEFWLRIISASISGLHLENASSFQGYEPDNNLVQLSLDPKERSSTPINRTNRKEKTLEDLIENCALESVRDLKLPGLFQAEGGNSVGTARAITTVDINFMKPMVTLHGGGILIIPKIKYILGIAISQSQIKIDRSDNLIFALALEDVVNKTVFGATQRINDQFTSIYPLGIRPEDIKEDPIQNGSIISITLSRLGAFDEFTESEAGKFVFYPEKQ
ncbi:MAG: restriction endonuclease [Proteobacteria bacterium]|nr:restriction endonuclease [Pseudomonadota bacterium]